MANLSEKQILINYLLGICTRQEQNKVEAWLEEKPGNADLLMRVAKDLGHAKSLPSQDKEDIKKAFFQKIDEQDNKSLSKKDSNFAERIYRASSLSRRQFWFKIAALVIIIGAIGLAGFMMKNNHEPNKQPEIVWQEQRLDYGKLATLTFGDGTVVKLNGGSELRYPRKFSEDQRIVYLTGEAFFDVTEDSSRPFIVHAGNATTEVLGTSFNIKAYENEDKLQVTVAEGKVAVTHQAPYTDTTRKGRMETVFLERNQWVTYRSEDRLMEKREGDIWEMIAWTEKTLVFNEMRLEEAARMLERWYGVEIILEDPGLKNDVLNGEHDDVSLEEVLKSIQFILDIEYSLKENKVRIWRTDEMNGKLIIKDEWKIDYKRQNRPDE